MRHTCSHCGGVDTITVKGHVGGTKSFEELTDAQRRASLAKMFRDARTAQRVYHRDKGARRLDAELPRLQAMV